MSQEQNSPTPATMDFDALASVEIQMTQQLVRGRNNRIQFEFPNFRVRSPSSGFPDQGRIEIVYTANREVMDPSSLEAYIAAYRQVTAFGEDVVNRIFDDLTAICSPRSLTVRGFFVSDGDLDLTVQASTEGNL